MRVGVARRGGDPEPVSLTHNIYRAPDRADYSFYLRDSVPQLNNTQTLKRVDCGDHVRSYLDRSFMLNKDRYFLVN